MQQNADAYVDSIIRVRYAETDQMGIAHHASYIIWFEIGRTDLCRVAGVSYREIEEKGHLLVVSEVCCRYRTSFRYDDEVTIRTRLGELASRAMEFRYELLARDGSVGATGMSRHLWVDRESRTPVRAPNALADLFKTFAKS